MPEPQETRTFAALEKHEWAKADVAKSYAQVFAKAADMVAPTLVKAVEAGPDRDVLDLCCGHGNVAAGLVNAGARVTGVDFSRAMLEMARSAVPAARFFEGDAMALDFDDQSFDAVTIGFGIPHVPNPPKVIAEARRVLRPGGRLAFSVWCGPDVDTALGYVFGAINQYGSPDITLPAGPGANDYADPELAFPVLEKAGFTELAQTYVASEWHVEEPGAPYDFFLGGNGQRWSLAAPSATRERSSDKSCSCIQSIGKAWAGTGVEGADTRSGHCSKGNLAALRGCQLGGLPTLVRSQLPQGRCGGPSWYRARADNQPAVSSQQSRSALRAFAMNTDTCAGRNYSTRDRTGLHRSRQAWTEVLGQSDTQAVKRLLRPHFMKLIKLVENGNVFAKRGPVLFATCEYPNIWRALIRLVQRSDTDKTATCRTASFSASDQSPDVTVSR